MLAPRDGKSEPEARAISASLSEGAKQIFCVAERKPAALIADLDLDGICGGMRAERNTPVGAAKFECAFE